MQLNEGNVFAQTCTSATTESHHILVHVIGTSYIHPPSGVEAVGILSKDFLVEMHHGGIDTNNVASRDELIADGQTLRGYSSRQSYSEDQIDISHLTSASVITYKAVLQARYEELL